MKIKAIFGLGNPPKEYAKTYHNVGSSFIDYLAKEFPPKESFSFKGNQYVLCQIGGSAVFLFKPMSFMNESGKLVAAAIKKLRISPEETLIVHDDSDIQLGKFKYSIGSRSAGHKGVESVINSLGTKDFNRLKIGIRTKPGKALDFVLKKTPAKDNLILNGVFQSAGERLSSNLKRSTAS